MSSMYSGNRSLKLVGSLGSKKADPMSAPNVATQGESSHRWRMALIAGWSLAMIALHLALRFGFDAPASIRQIPLLATLILGGTPIIFGLFRKVLQRDFGSDLLAGISIITSVLLGEYLAGSIVVLMLAGARL